MKHNFSMIPQVNIPRSTFDRSHGYKTTFDTDFLIPFFVDEALPGDTFEQKHTIFARMTTPIVPFMDNLILETFYFAVPNRLVWDNWQKFNGEQKKPGDSTDYLIPQVVAPVGGFTESSLYDYMGIPTKKANLSVNALYMRAYNLIYNEWFRDQNLIDSLEVPTGDGPDLHSKFVLQKRGKRHDYFTSALPWPQKGNAVSVALNGNIPVFGSGKTLGFTDGTNLNGVTIYNSESMLKISNQFGVNVGTASTTGFSGGNKVYGIAQKSQLTPAQYSSTGLQLDGSMAQITINALRQSFQLQRMLERDARGGTRYTEIIRSHFGVISPDARMQRPEYLGGSKSYVNVVPVQQTSQTGTTPQGNLAGFAVVQDNGGFAKSFTEHCVIIGLLNVRADLTYQQGLDRKFSRRTRYDYYWPSLAHLGEQEIKLKELYAQGTSEDDEVFGYQERYAEYRYFPSKITGKLRSNATAPLDMWHLSQNFSSKPVLNKTFIEEAVPMTRVLAVANQPHFVMDSYIKQKCARPMPVYSVPGLIDHF